MTYTGEMVLPRNAVMMIEDEMTYTEGGNGWYNSVGFIGTALDVVIIAVTGGIAYGATRTLVSTIKKFSGAITRVVKTKLLSLIGSGAANLVKTAIDIAVTIAGTSIGYLIAKGIDIADGKNNGYCFG